MSGPVQTRLEEIRECPHCGGVGYVLIDAGADVWQTCRVCDGTGQILHGKKQA